MKTIKINYYLVNGMTGRKVWGKNQKQIKNSLPQLKKEKLIKVGYDKWQIEDNEKIVCGNNGNPKVISLNNQ